ncbi:hypothetical protein GPECTOR_97g764 [Gonium pectorale]|uniref:Uncharacterized protein n=1 Tax=Gonium pectorale TaxID=33097 RepID=A0A150G021_GONPE|nr:hypothetical protein GPECTOR_97g764 [Gonium pectorale]|eukprot:KXZ43226.1 hypothetical protein GPECTOR_97g764 [Gonium pectorale]
MDKSDADNGSGPDAAGAAGEEEPAIDEELEELDYGQQELLEEYYDEEEAAAHAQAEAAREEEGAPAMDAREPRSDSGDGDSPGQRAPGSPRLIEQLGTHADERSRGTHADDEHAADRTTAQPAARDFDRPSDRWNGPGNGNGREIGPGSGLAARNARRDAEPRLARAPYGPPNMRREEPQPFQRQQQVQQQEQRERRADEEQLPRPDAAAALPPRDGSLQPGTLRDGESPQNGKARSVEEESNEERDSGGVAPSRSVAVGVG